MAKKVMQCAARIKSGARCSRVGVRMVAWSEMLAYWFCAQHAPMMEQGKVEVGEYAVR